MSEITVIGSGNIGYATAGHLAHKGFEVCLCGSKPSKKINITGVLNAEVELDMATTNRVEAVKDSKYIILTATSLYHAEIIQEVAESLSDDSVVILFPGKFGGSLYIENIIKNINPDFDGYVVESHPLYAARMQNENTINISGIKNKIRFASTTLEKTRIIAKEIQQLFPMLEPTDSWLERSFCDIGWLLHVPTFLFSINRIENKEPFLFYYEGVTHKIAEIIEALDNEKIKLAKHLGIQAHSLTDILEEYYGTTGDSVYEVIHNNVPYQKIKGPDSLDHRYVLEEISEYYIPMYELSVLLNLDLPVLKSIIDLSGLITKHDFYKIGRSLNKIVQDVNYFHETHEKQLVAL